MSKPSQRHTRRQMISPVRNFRAWLASWVQMRRRHRISPPSLPERVIHLTSDGHGQLVWALNFPVVFEDMGIFFSEDGSTNWDSYDGEYAHVGFRGCNGVEGYFRVAIVDYDGEPIPPYSNVVFSDGL